MKINEQLKYDEFLDYLRGLKNWHGSESDYDFVGITHIMLSSLENLKQNALDAELEDIGECFDEEQKDFFLKIARYLEAHSYDD